MIFSFEAIVPQGLFRAGAGLREGIARSAATELESTVSGHFYEMPGREYWRRAGDLTEAHPEQPGVVTVSQRGVALHLYGGTVHPGRGDSSKTGQPTKLLALPADKGVRESPIFYPGMVFRRVRRGYPHLRGLLVLPGQRRRGAAEPQVRVMFRLVDQATIRPNPEVLPPDDRLEDAMQRGLEAYLHVLR